MNRTNVTSVSHRKGAGVHGLAFGVMLAAAMAASTLFVPSFGVLSTFLIAEFDIDRAQLGLLVTATTAVTALGAPVAGRLVDVVGGRRVLLGLLALSSISLVLFASSASYVILLGVAALGGLSNAAGNPATNHLISARMPSGKRGVVMGIKQSGVQMGIAVVGLTLPPAALVFGWRGAVLLLSAACLIGLLIASRLIPRDEAWRSTVVGSHARVPRAMWWVTGYAALMGAGNAAVISFVPLYAQEKVGLSVTVAGLAAAAIGFLGVPSRILIARRAERASDIAAVLGWLAIISVSAGVFILSAAHVGAWALGVGVALSGTSVVAWNAVAMLAAVELSELGASGRSAGLVMLGFMGGFTLSPPLIGWSVDSTDAYDLAWAAASGAFALAAVVTFAWRKVDPP